ncbi:MAG TPA: glycosyltransferase family 2 protein [Candidatus Limnocylindria bacterium]|nr:glycosyltransferase family 2 protein [Candidatus Limnocylindria bacterium]
MRPHVSVVIPAHNPGPYVEPCIRSILRQTLRRDRFEVVFVDDGSTDGTGDRLDRLAREQPHVRVIHIPASGAPGRPRNVGLGAAIGEYIQFLDADDELAPRALQRLYRMARANRSDIVLGKFASETMSRRQDLFTRTRATATLANTPQLLDASLGPTKLFRAALLREAEVAFPEGWRQMEDQLFTLRAYLAADVISILGDEPCYYFNKREDEGHISAELVDAASHVEHLRELLGEVGPSMDAQLRARLASRLYRTEVLNRLVGEQFLAAPEDYQEVLFDAFRVLALELFGDVHEGLGAFARIRSRLLLDGDLENLRELARRTQAFSVDARVTHASWTHGRLSLDFRAILSRGSDAHPLTLIERDGSTLLDPAVADDLVGPVDVTGELASIRVQLSVVDRQTALEWIVSGDAGLQLRPVGDANDELRIPSLVGLVQLDTERVGPAERPLDDGAWDVQIRWSGLGFGATDLLRIPPPGRREERQPIWPAVLGRPVRWVVPRAGEDGALGIAIGGLQRVPASIDAAGLRAIRGGALPAIAMPIATDRVGLVESGVLRLHGATGQIDLPARFSGFAGGLTLSVDARAGGHGLVPRGRYELTAHVGGSDAAGLAVGAALVRDDGRFVLLGLQRESTFARARSWLAWTGRSSLLALRRRARAAFRRLPSGTKDAIRAGLSRRRS